jgi:hypothetical protein
MFPHAFPKRTPTLALFAAVFILLIAAGAGAADFYVAKNGRDANPGSEFAPWLTITKAANTLQAGDTAYIKAGTYNERVVVNVQGSAAGGFVTFRNYANDAVYVDGTGINLGVWPYGGVIEASGKSYLRFQGLHIQNCQGNAYGGISLFISGGTGASHIEILDNEVTAHTGITALGCIGNNLSYVTIDNNEVHHVNTNAQEAIRVAQDVRYFRITNNRVHDTSNIGIDAVGWGAQPMYGLIQNNVCYQNAQASDWAHGIYVDGGAHILIENNLIYDSRCGIEVGAEYPEAVAHNIIVRRNLIYRCWQVGLTLGGVSIGGRTMDCAVMQNTLVNNNTTSQPDLWTREFSLNYAQGTNLLMNNIAFDMRDHNLHLIHNANGNTFGTMIHDYNDYVYPGTAENLPALFWRDPLHHYATLSAWQAATGQDAHSHAVDPAFANPEQDDFHLQPGSLCVDAGNFFTQTTSAGSGTLIPVADARAFCDGYSGLFPGDAIQVGAQTANLVSANYAQRTLQVDRVLSWSSQEGVSLPFAGSRPDQGAFESGLSEVPGTVVGFVSDKSTGAPIAGAAVGSGSITTQTRSDGTYRLVLPNGGRTLVAEKSGCLRQIQAVNLPNGGSLTLNWQMPAETSRLPAAEAADLAQGWSVSPGTYIRGKSPTTRITFSNLPGEADIRIYTLSGRLITSIYHHASSDYRESWDVSDVASGIYLYHIQSPQAEKKGKLCIIK